LFSGFLLSLFFKGKSKNLWKIYIFDIILNIFIDFHYYICYNINNKY
jgi:hypothetical protein